MQQKLSTGALFTILLLLVIQFSCSYDEGLFPRQDQGGRFEMHLPDFISSTERLSEDTDFQYQNRFRTFYVIVLPESKAETGKSLVDFADNEIDILRQSVDSIHSDTVFTEVVNDLYGVQYKADMYLGEEVFYYRLAFVEGEDDFYSIVIWTTQKRKESYGEMIEEIIYSFREL